MDEDNLDDALGTGTDRMQMQVADFASDNVVGINEAELSVEGDTRDMIGKARKDFDSATTKTAAKADEVIDRVRGRLDSVADQVDPFVHEKPYIAVGLAAGVGLLLGLLIAGRGPKVIYVRSKA